jgi:riboflavin transporter FmnP
MNTKKLTLSIIFAALTVALNPAISHIGVPAPYMPFLIYNLWEIPIVAAFLLIGPKSGIGVTILNAILLFAFFPGPLPTGPFYNLVAIFSTLIGVYLAQRMFTCANLEGKALTMQEAKLVTAATAFGIFSRVLVMTVVNYVTLRFDYPIGFSMKEFEVLAFLPAGALFNATLALYTIPIAYFIVRTVRKNVRLNLV